jgi:hypothetical protein
MVPDPALARGRAVLGVSASALLEAARNKSGRIRLIGQDCQTGAYDPDHGSNAQR